ncbi:MAG TPA: ectonucleotide pyrophosphatase/phosphodiesterase [Melioribacteraceae bacterium]|nr:ectonucleotide pyrophosphatase/phosphodiesterase [Melioribacteraceae bacterium]
MKNLFKILFVFLFLFINISAENNSYVILVSFDGFRWDYLNRNLTPTLENVINNGVRALSLRPCFPSKTFPNHISIATGMHPQNHGIISNSFENPFTNENYGMRTTGSKWYNGEFIWETLERNGIKTASYFWPGSEIEYSERRPSLYKKYEHYFPYYNRIDSLIAWLSLPEEKRPHFLTVYFDATDTYGHKYGPNSPEVNKTIQSLDTLSSYLLKRLDEIGMGDKVNVIFLSDHGMTEIGDDKFINIEDIVKGYSVELQNDGPVMMISTKPENRDEVYELLKKQKNFSVYKKEEMPDYYNFNKHPFINDLVLVADLGYSLLDNKSIKKASEYDGKGNHGFSNNELDMHGIFIAKGPAFKKGFKTGTVWNIDIYPLICKIFGIFPRSNIDGKSERIEFLLK